MLTTKELKDLLMMYQRDALKTALRTDYGKDLLIRACGLIGEWGEYLRAGAITRGEELADCFWYAAALADLVGVSIADFVISPTITKPDVDLTTCAIAACAEYAKKVGGHGRDKPVIDLTRHLGDVVNQLVSFSLVLGPSESLPVILAANVAKLRARHAQAGAGGFDPNYGKPVAPPAAPALRVVQEGTLPIEVPPGYTLLDNDEYGHLQDLAHTGQACVENHHVINVEPVSITVPISVSSTGESVKVTAEPIGEHLTGGAPLPPRVFREAEGAMAAHECANPGAACDEPNHPLPINVDRALTDEELERLTAPKRGDNDIDHGA